ncbi:TetR/AcrR family transcriptional regulator [Streptomyces sp. NPDC020794]|uniref:TetR/AcrR family transcriptional regulator n=1 Tax=unclassified Streptomyces TaxID=2593676 RepID=UPI0036E9D49C
MTTSDTRRHIQQTALELFTEQGYERTSLREIAERLGVTKAALYYHFKAKEDILTPLFEEWIGPVNEVIEWARTAPGGLATKQEALRRYETALARPAPLLKVFHADWTAVRALPVGAAFQDTMRRVVALFRDTEASLPDQSRCIGAVLTLHAGVLALDDIEAAPEEKRAPALHVALDLLASAHPPD